MHGVVDGMGVGSIATRTKMAFTHRIHNERKQQQRWQISYHSILGMIVVNSFDLFIRVDFLFFFFIYCPLPIKDGSI